MKLHITYDVYLLPISFPKLIANFGLLSQDYRLEHTTLHIFLCVIVDISLRMLTLVFVVLSICPSSKKGTLPDLCFLDECWYQPVCCSVAINGDRHPQLDFCQMVSEGVAVNAIRPHWISCLVI